MDTYLDKENQSRVYVARFVFNINIEMGTETWSKVERKELP